MSDEKQPIDTVALQSQIDLSLSLTFDLVASWMNHSEGLTLGGKAQQDDDDENELESYLHRPPT